MRRRAFARGPKVNLYAGISRMSIVRVLRLGAGIAANNKKSPECCTDGVRPVVFMLERVPKKRVTR